MALPKETLIVLERYCGQKMGNLSVLTNEFNGLKPKAYKQSNGAQWNYFLDYIENGKQAPEWMQGRSQLAEIVVQKFICAWSSWSFNGSTYFTNLSPKSMDNSVCARGFDIYTTEDSRGKKEQHLRVGYDVTTLRLPNSQIDHNHSRFLNKLACLPANQDLGIPVLIIPVRKLSGFLEYLGYVREQLKKGENDMLNGLSENELLQYNRCLTQIFAQEVERVAEIIMLSSETVMNSYQRSRIMSNLAFFSKYPLAEAMRRYL